MARFLQLLFFCIVVYPVTRVYMGLNIRNRQRLPSQGPLIIAANHNSHLDAVILMSLFPLHKLHLVRPVAAADYFLKTPFMSWFSQTIINIIPIERRREFRVADPLKTSQEALERGEVLIFFPEGSRGEPEQKSDIKTGLALLAQRCPEATIVPIRLRGMGRALPKGDAIILPFFCDVIIGEGLRWQGSRKQLMDSYVQQLEQLAI